MKNYKFFLHKECEFFPCHKDIIEKNFNCIFCYCPLYEYDDCGGNYKILDNGIKDCSKCKFVHNRKNYDDVIEKIRELKFDN